MKTKKTIMVSAGTYHHPFNRMIDWLEPWVLTHPEVHVTIQHGPSRELPGAENIRALPYGRLIELCSEADVVVLQGGAGGIMDMRGIRRIPIVVPRVPRDNEVVDDHQLRFTERADSLGIIRRVTTREQLWACLDAAVAGTLATRSDNPVVTPGQANLVTILRERPPRIGPVTRMRRLVRSFVNFLPGRGV